MTKKGVRYLKKVVSDANLTQKEEEYPPAIDPNVVPHVYHSVQDIPLSGTASLSPRYPMCTPLYPILRYHIQIPSVPMCTTLYRIYLWQVPHPHPLCISYVRHCTHFEVPYQNPLCTHVYASVPHFEVPYPNPLCTYVYHSVQDIPLSGTASLSPRYPMCTPLYPILRYHIQIPSVPMCTTLYRIYLCQVISIPSVPHVYASVPHLRYHIQIPSHAEGSR